MKRSFFYFAAFVVASVAPAAAKEEEQPPSFIDNIFYWYDEQMLKWTNPQTLAEIGDNCAVSVVGLIPDPYHWGPTYYGDVRTVAACFDGLPVLGNTFHNDAAARQRIVESDFKICCLQLKCGSDKTGYCTSRGLGCKDLGVDPLPVDPTAASDCPGSNSQCCPTVAQKSDASTGDDIDLTAFGGTAGSDDIFSGGEVSMGTPGQDMGLGLDTPFEGSLNPDDWTEAPLASENLFLANDNTDDDGVIASLGGSLGEGFDTTG